MRTADPSGPFRKNQNWNRSTQVTATLGAVVLLFLIGHFKKDQRGSSFTKGEAL
jgi:hypothetical protein